MENLERNYGKEYGKVRDEFGKNMKTKKIKMTLRFC